MNGEYISMSVAINGNRYSVSEDLPTLMKLSRGPMSRLGAMAGAIDRMSGKLAIMIDNAETPCDFIAWQPEAVKQKHGYLVTQTRKEHHDCD